MTSASPRPRTWPSCCATARCPVEFERSAEQQVSPTLGEDSLEAGLLAGLIGLAAVALYMLLYYRASAWSWSLGLGVWSALMYSRDLLPVGADAGLALSLAGVIGIIVSVGTTVDSYVVYFERLKDEVKSGKTDPQLDRAWLPAAPSARSSPPTCRRSSAPACSGGSRSARCAGFAFFLGLSVVLDVVVAYFFTRPLVSLLRPQPVLHRGPLFGVARGLGQRIRGHGRRWGVTATAELRRRSAASSPGSTTARPTSTSSAAGSSGSRSRRRDPARARRARHPRRPQPRHRLHRRQRVGGPGQRPVGRRDVEDALEELGIDDTKVQTVGGDLRVQTPDDRGHRRRAGAARAPRWSTALAELSRHAEARGRGRPNGRAVVGRRDLREGACGPSSSSSSLISIYITSGSSCGWRSARWPRSSTTCWS